MSLKTVADKRIMVLNNQITSSVYNDNVIYFKNCLRSIVHKIVLSIINLIRRYTHGQFIYVNLSKLVYIL